MSEAYILDAVRTPRARRKGKYSSVHPADLLTYPLNALIERNKISPDQIEDVIAGCVTQIGEQGWCVARNSILAAGWPDTVPGTTINRLCGSGQQACHFAAAGVLGGNYDLAIGAGLEHMTRVPMFSDGGGEESPLVKKHHPDLVHQGLAAEMICEEYKLTREELDQYSVRSQERATKAIAEGYFKNSLVPVPYTDEDGNQGTLTEDDTNRPETTLEGLSELKTVFKEDGFITAGNASAIVDGAAAVLIGSEAKANELNLKPRARFVSMLSIGSPPKIMLTGPIEASKQVLAKAGLKAADIDVWEINEAFAPVPIITMNALELDPEKVNIHGGGISLGHPLGATGAMLVGTCLDELERTDGKYGLITMCIGLGMGIAAVIERP